MQHIFFLQALKRYSIFYMSFISLWTKMCLWTNKDKVHCDITILVQQSFCKCFLPNIVGNALTPLSGIWKNSLVLKQPSYCLPLCVLCSRAALLRMQLSSYLGRPPKNWCNNLRWFCTCVKPLQYLFGLTTTNEDRGVQLFALKPPFSACFSRTSSSTTLHEKQQEMLTMMLTGYSSYSWPKRNLQVRYFSANQTDNLHP